MRLSLLLDREPYGSILEQTLSRHWSEESGDAVSVHWAHPAPGDQIWRGNIYLNFFSVEGVDPACFEVITREFGHSRVAWRRAMQSAYVQAAIRPPTRRWLSQVCFGISPHVPKAEEMLVIGGNRRIRIIQPSAARSVVIHKAGYERTAFDREVAARLGPAAPVAPKFHRVNADGSVFEEAYFVGTPVNRLPMARELQLREEALNRLVERVHQPTLLVGCLRERLDEVMSRIAMLAPVASRTLAPMVAKVGGAAGAAPVGLTFTHGDFQDANILVQGESVLIIDWETAGNRSQFYDLATLRSGIRQSADRGGAWRSWAARWMVNPSALTGLLVPAETATARLAHVVLWWLEDCLLRLEESQMRRFGVPMDGAIIHQDLPVLGEFLRLHG